MSDFVLNVLTYLSELVKVIPGGTEIDFSNAFNYINRNWNSSKEICLQRFTKNFDKVIQLLESEECRDTSLIANVMAAGYLMYCSREVCGVCKKYMLNKMRMNHTEREISIFYQLFIRPYMLNSEILRHMDMVHDAIKTGNVGFLQRLLIFGAILLRPMYDETECYNTQNVIQMLLPSHHTVGSMNTPNFYDALRNLDPSSRRRLFLVMRGLEVLANIFLIRSDSLNSKKKVQNYVCCLELAFESIPAPVISSEEIRNCLKYLLGGLITNEVIKNLSDLYENYFPESKKPMAPRSLQHLCRCSVRQILREYGNLPHSIKSLPVPQKIKNYLRIVAEDEKEPIYSSEQI